MQKQGQKRKRQENEQQQEQPSNDGKISVEKLMDEEKDFDMDAEMNNLETTISSAEDKLFHGLDMFGINEKKILSQQERISEQLGIERKEHSQMKDAFKVQASGEVFSDTQIAELQAKLHVGLIKNLTQFMKFEKLTAVQQKAFEHILDGKDVLIASATGSGKTLAYSLPLIQRILNVTGDCFNDKEKAQSNRKDGTYALVLAPTRELCMQIYNVLRQLCNPFPWIIPGMLIGGEKTKSEKARLRKGVTILVATPGRLNYHLQNTQTFAMHKLQTIVLDEADGYVKQNSNVNSIMELGDENQIRRIFVNIGSKVQADQKPQTVLVSATLNESVKRLASFTLQNEVSIGYENSQASDVEIFEIPASLVQYYVVAPRYLFIPLLVSFLRSRTSEVSLKYGKTDTKVPKPSKILVFCGTADGVEFYHLLFGKCNMFPNEDGAIKKLGLEVPLFKLHSDMTTEQRGKVYTQFSKIPTGVMFTTDLAARGLDFDGVDWIVQYDPPGEPKEYLHRIGRTARLGRSGNAVMFLAENEILYLKLLEKFGLKLHKMSGMSLFEHLNLAYGNIVARSPTAACKHLLNIVSKYVSNTNDVYQWACAAFLSFLRGYTSYYKDTRYIFHAKNLRIDHAKRMYGLEEKGRVLMKQQPEVGRIKNKMHERATKKSDLQTDVAGDSDLAPPMKPMVPKDKTKNDDEDVAMSDLADNADGFIIDKDGEELLAADEEIIGSEDEDSDNDENTTTTTTPKKNLFQQSVEHSKEKAADKVNIRAYMKKLQRQLDQNRRKLPPIRVDPSLTPKHVREQRKLMEYTMTREEADDHTIVGQVGGSKALKAKLLGETKQGSSKDIRKKEKFAKRVISSVLQKGRTSDAKQLAEKNPFDVRKRGVVAALMNSISSEFDSAVKQPPRKKQRLE